MQRNTALKILNPLLGVLIANQVATGLLRDALPEEAFEMLHEWTGFLLAAAAVLHVILNWNWVRANFSRRPSAPNP
jgi:hypothetical protein